MSKKRANGEGNIRKRKNGRWEGRYTAGYDPKTGKRINKNVLGKTQAEVREKPKTAMAECQGLDVSREADEHTVATWLKMWYELYAKPNVRTATANRYQLIIDTYTVPRIGNIKLKKMTTRHLQKLYKELLENGRIHVGKNQSKGLSTTTVRRAVARLELTPFIPTLAKIDVAAAKTADSSAKKNHMVDPSFIPEISPPAPLDKSLYTPAPMPVPLSPPPPGCGKFQRLWDQTRS